MRVFTGGASVSRCSQEFTCTIVLDEKGRIVLPSLVRKNFGLEKGSGVRLEFSLAENRVMLIPLTTKFSLEKKEGFV